MSAALSLTEAMPSIARSRASASTSPLRALRRQVDLGHVAGDDDLRARPHPRQEHLHLRDGRVLGLVENDERLVQRPAAHVGQRNHLDQVLFRVALEQIVIHHFVQGIQAAAADRG